MEASDVIDRSNGPIGWYFRAIRFLAGASMLVIVAVMIVQVVARYVFNSSLIWAEELCRYLLIWQTFLFIGMAYYKGELIAVDILPNLLKPRVRLALKVIVTVPVLIFLWLMTVNGYAYASRFSGQIVPAIDFIAMSITGRGVGLSIFWVYVSVSVGSALLALHMIGGIVAEARDLLAANRRAAAGD